MDRHSTLPRSDEGLPFADLRMDGVGFSRVRSAAPFVVAGLGGTTSLCYLVRRGRAWLEVDSAPALRVELPPGSIVALSGLVQHWFKSDRDAACRRAVPMTVEALGADGSAEAPFELLVGHAPLEALASTNVVGGAIVILPHSMPQVTRRIWAAMDMIQDELTDPASLGGEHLAVRRLAEIMLLNVTRYVAARGRRDGAAGLASVADVRIMRAIAAVARSPASGWTVAALARVAGMSRTSFAIRCHELTRKTPLQIVRDVRLRLAANELAHGSVSVEDLAADTGYGSAAAFIRAFQRRYGATPARWRRAHAPRPSETARRSGTTDQFSRTAGPRQP